jgi:hypothetical protein
MRAKQRLTFYAANSGGWAQPPLAKPIVGCERGRSLTRQETPDVITIHFYWKVIGQGGKCSRKLILTTRTVCVYDRNIIAEMLFQNTSPRCFEWLDYVFVKHPAKQCQRIGRVS